MADPGGFGSHMIPVRTEYVCRSYVIVLHVHVVVCYQFNIIELPWDSPTSECPEYCEWCKQNYFFSPWSKISNEPLGKEIYL